MALANYREKNIALWYYFQRSRQVKNRTTREEMSDQEQAAESAARITEAGV